MARDSRYAVKAPAPSPCATSTSPTLVWLTDRSRCHDALLGSDAAKRSAMARDSRYAVKAPAPSPCATSTLPILLWLTDRSRCHDALLGFCLTKSLRRVSTDLSSLRRLPSTASFSSASARSKLNRLQSVPASPSAKSGWDSSDVAHSSPGLGSWPCSASTCCANAAVAPAFSPCARSPA